MTPRRFACAEPGSSARRPSPGAPLCAADIPAARRTPARLTEHDKRERAALSFDVLSDFHAAYMRPAQTSAHRSGTAQAVMQAARGPVTPWALRSPCPNRDKCSRGGCSRTSRPRVCAGPRRRWRICRQRACCGRNRSRPRGTWTALSAPPFPLRRARFHLRPPSPRRYRLR